MATAQTTTTTNPQAQAVRARSMTREAWVTRALEIAERDHLIYRALEIAERDHLIYRARWQQGAESYAHVFTVPSRSTRGEHTVRLHSDGAFVCDCPAATHGLPCGHVGSAAHLWRQITEAMTEAAARANEQYHEFADFLATRGY